MHFATGRVFVNRNFVTRGNATLAEWVSYARPNSDVPLAIVEPESNDHGVCGGMRQSLPCADALRIPRVSTWNGDASVRQDRAGQGAPAAVQNG
jgi:type I site-specific restriction endonuclease